MDADPSARTIEIETKMTSNDLTADTTPTMAGGRTIKAGDARTDDAIGRLKKGIATAGPNVRISDVRSHVSDGLAERAVGVLSA